MEPTRHVGCKNVTDNTLSDLCFTIMSHKKPGRTELKYLAPLMHSYSSVLLN